MSETWQVFPLSSIAEIRFSNVNKKTIIGEIPVRLCNYMDVYANGGYITKNLPFMDATATRAEIDRFGISKGDVMLTKDSETPDDIGISAVVLDEISILVCGYHLALLKPNLNKIHPGYLNKQLSTQKTNAYYAARANGSTRYGLSSGVIASTPILVAPINQQRRIAEILSTLDSTIKHTEALIAKYQQIKAGLMHDLFTRGILPNGKLRPTQEEAPGMYKETEIGWVPKEWECKYLDNIAIRGSGHTPNKSRPDFWNGGIKWISLADSSRLDKVYISETENEISQLGIDNSSAVLHPPGIVVLSRDAGVGKSAITTCNMAVSQHFMCWRCGPALDNHYLYYWLQNHKRDFENIATGSTIPTIGLRFFKLYRINVPKNIAEQKRIGEELLSLDNTIFAAEIERNKLCQQKSGLMHDLLSGKVQVNLKNRGA